MVKGIDILPKKGKAGKLKRNWSAIANLTENMQGFSSRAKAMRKLFYDKTGNKKFKESNYRKMVQKGRTFTVNDVRSAHAQIVKLHNDVIRREYNRKIKENTLEAMAKLFAKQPRKIKKQGFNSWLRKNRSLQKTTYNKEKRLLTFARYKKSNKATLDKLQNFESVEEMYNSPD